MRLTKARHAADQGRSPRARRYAPDPYAEKVWNVWWIGVSPSRYGEGKCVALLSYLEQTAASLGARVIVIETSDQPSLTRARNFYLKLGYEENRRTAHPKPNLTPVRIFANAAPATTNGPAIKYTQSGKQIENAKPLVGRLHRPPPGRLIAGIACIGCIETKERAGAASVTFLMRSGQREKELLIEIKITLIMNGAAKAT